MAEDADKSVAIVALSNKFRKTTSPHEMAHVVGALHQESPFEHKFAYAYDFKVFEWPQGPYRARTAIWGGSVKKRTIPYFSNPNVEFANKATGTITNDNARLLRDEGCRIASLDAYIHLSASITGTHEAFENQSITLASLVVGGDAPISYKWEVSLNGIDFSPIGTNSNVQYTIPVGGNGHFVFFRLTVDDAFAVISTAYHRVFKSENFAPPPPDGTGGVILNVYPNPVSVSDQFRIHYNLERTSEVQLIVVDPSGRSRTILSEVMEKGNHEFQVQTSEMPLVQNSWIVLKCGNRICDYFQIVNVN